MTVPRKALSAFAFFALFLAVILNPLFFVSASSMEGWSRTYGGAADDAAAAVVQTSDGGYAVAGYTESFGAGNADFWLVKIDAYGVMKWNMTYGGAHSERASSLIETSDGGYIIAGNMYPSNDSEAYHFWLVKTDNHGVMEWNQTHSRAHNQQLSALVETSDGGYAYSTGIGCPLVKTDAEGNIQWNQTYGEEGFYSLESLVAVSDGGYALAGTAGFITTQFWLVKTDEYGNLEWSNEYGEYGTSTARSLVEASDGGYALAGDANPVGPRGFDFVLVKTDSSGNLEWNMTYGGTGWDTASLLVAPSDGGYALAGTMNAYTTDDSDFWLVKTDRYGNMEWNRTYGEAESHSINSLAATSDGGYVLAGWCGNQDELGQTDFWVIKTDVHGIVPEFALWTILPLVLTVTVGILVLRKKLTTKSVYCQ
jgi:hypothetical protein